MVKTCDNEGRKTVLEQTGSLLGAANRTASADTGGVGFLCCGASILQKGIQAVFLG